MKDRTLVIVIIIVAVLLVLCICCAVFFGWGAYVIQEAIEESSGIEWTLVSGAPTATPFVIRPTNPPTGGNGDDGNQDAAPLFGDIATQTLYTLETTIVPSNDPNELAERLGGVPYVPDTIDPPLAYFQVGDQRQFWASDLFANENFQITATLAGVTDHAYFWIENSIRYNSADLQALMDEFETQIYPTNQNFFGSEWNPGIDGDPHIYILYTGDLGGAAGYFSNADEMHPLAHEYSNAVEMFYINADSTRLSGDYIYSVLAHEYQHMIHWNMDRNEDSWLDEGFSELAALMNGYGGGGFEYSFITNPDHQLNDWPNDQNATIPYYGAAFLFTTYMLDHLGEEVTKAVVAHPANGMESIDLVLDYLGIDDLLRGVPLTADTLALDWALANYIKDQNVADGRYFIGIYPNSPQARETETIRECTPGAQTRDVHQYGTDYIRITCPGEHTMSFEGSMVTQLLPADAYSGNYAFWSNKGDSSDMLLTRAFDFSGHSGDLTLVFYTWYYIELDWDYVYLEASTDGGNTWEILTTPSGTAEDPSGNSYGWGWTGLSNGGPVWMKESVDLSRFAGQQVLLRFEYITDAAVNGEGMLIDDIAIPEIGYFSDFESDDGGWEAEGFVRVGNLLPQTFQLALVSHGRQTAVEYIDLATDNTTEITFTIGGDVEAVTLVVMGTTRFTRQLAAYRFDFLP